MASRNPNRALIEAANKAAACGMSYGSWMSAGCPEPPKKQIKRKNGLQGSRPHNFNRPIGKRGG